jgi:hypothetical protein
MVGHEKTNLEFSGSFVFLFFFKLIIKEIVAFKMRTVLFLSLLSLALCAGQPVTFGTSKSMSKLICKVHPSLKDYSLQVQNTNSGTTKDKALSHTFGVLVPVAKFAHF